MTIVREFDEKNSMGATESSFKFPLLTMVDSVRPNGPKVGAFLAIRSSIQVMIRRNPIWLSVLIFFFLSSCAGWYPSRVAISPEQWLAQQIDQQIAVPELQTALVGIMVQSARTGEILYQRNANTLMMPASNQKILTCAAALIKLGPEFRYQTPVYISGRIEAGILKGDIIVVASGDPTFSYRFCDDKTDGFIFRAWADSLHAHGIYAIEGDVIGVDDLFDDESLGYGWTLNNVSYGYSAPIGAFMYNENMARLFVLSDSSGEYLSLKLKPDPGYLQLEPDLEIHPNATELTIRRIPETNRLQVIGKVQPGEYYIENVSIHDPTLHFLSALKWELVMLGIPIYGQPRDADHLNDPTRLASKKLLFVHRSVPLKQVLTVLMKESQNLYAESLVKLLGARFGRAGSFDEGAKVVQATLRRLGMDENSYGYKDGSGLSRYNYVSPAQLVTILRNMCYHRYGSIFRETLPIAGVDGTMDYRLKGTLAQGRISAKTGTISNARCLSGYATTRDGETLIFSTMFNNFLCDVNVVMDVQDRICLLLTSFPRRR